MSWLIGWEKNRATVYRYEKDDIKDMPITVLEPLARVLETTPADLMGWKDESDLAQAELSLQDQQAYAIDTLYSVFGDREVEHFKKYIEPYFGVLELKSAEVSK